MATIYQLKPAFQGLLRPLVRLLADRGVTANQVTIFACFLSVSVGGWLALRPAAQPGELSPLLSVPFLLFFRMALNAIDGMLAREHGMKSRLGGVLNELTDVISDTALYLPFGLIPGVSAPLVVIVSVLAIISEMAGVVAVTIGSSRRYDGPMGKSDRAFGFGLIALLLGLGVQPGFWVQGLLGTKALLLVRTIWNRSANALLENQV
jgi:CDP-diacylglycerol--glycerol-3-phosphate 3-phosphatidyltransferase